MDNIFKLLRRNSKQIFSLMLAFVVFVENPLTALASPTTNESFNISKPVVLDDDSPENFDPDTYTGEPFYFDENGKMMTNAFTPDHYYVGSSGAYLTNCWFKHNGKDYYAWL